MDAFKNKEQYSVKHTKNLKQWLYIMVKDWTLSPKDWEQVKIPTGITSIMSEFEVVASALKIKSKIKCVHFEKKYSSLYIQIS